LENERFGVPVCSSNFRFLHLLRAGYSVPKTITSRTNEIKSDREGTGGVAAVAAGVPSLSDDGLATAGLTVSDEGLTVAIGAASAAAFVAECL